MSVIPFEITAEMPYNLSPDDNFAVDLDIASWLDSDTIASVVFSATDEDGVSATSTVLDSAENGNSETVIKPYIKSGGVSGKQYKVKMLVTTNTGDEKTFYLRWACGE